MRHGFPSIDSISVSILARAAVSGGYETVFEFDANFKRTVRIRSPKSGSGRCRRGHVSNASLRHALEAGVRPASKLLKKGHQENTADRGLAAGPV
jgi:hypothetical protein